MPRFGRSFPQRGVTALRLAWRVIPSQNLTLTPTTVTHTAQPVTFTKPIRKTLTAATSTDAAQTQNIDKARGITTAVETDAAQARRAAHPRSLTAITETDSAQPKAASHLPRLTSAAETDAAQPLVRFNQASYRFRNDDGDEVTATWRRALNTPDSVPIDTLFRLRVAFEEYNGGDPISYAFDLQYRRKPSGGSFGAWTNITSGSSHVAYDFHSQLASGGSTTRQIWPSATNFVGGRQIDVGGSQSDYGPLFKTEYEFGLRTQSGGGAALGDTYEFRVVAGTDALATYTNTPSLTVAVILALTPTTETDTARPQDADKKLGVAGAAETDAAQPLRAAHPRSLTASTETDSAQTARAAHPRSLVAATETDAVQAKTFTKTIRKTLGVAVETSAAQALTVVKTIRKSLTSAIEASTAQAAKAVKVRALGVTTETDTAQARAASKRKTVGNAAETDAAQPVKAVKARTLGPAAETDTAQPKSFAKTIRKTLSSALESDLAQTLTRTGARALGPAAETDTAQAKTFVKTIRKTLGFAAETDAAQARQVVKSKALISAVETSLAVAKTFVKTIRKTLISAIESDLAVARTASKSKALGAATEVDTSVALAKSKRLTVGASVETDTAPPKTFTQTGPVIDQNAYRWRNDDGDEITASWRQPLNTPDVIPLNTTIRLRFAFQETAGADPPSQSYNVLEYRRKPAAGAFGPWTPVATSGTATPVAFNAASGLINGNAATRQIWPTATGYATGRVYDGAGTANVDYAPNFKSEGEFGFRLNSAGGAVNGDTYEFRMSVGGVPFTLTSTPSLVAGNHITLVPVVSAATAQPVTFVKPIRMSLTAAVETDAGQSLAYRAIHRSLIPATGVAAAAPLVYTRSVAYDQDAYRFRNDDGTEATASWRQPLNTPDTLDLDTIVRLRIAFEETNGGDPLGQQYQLQYRRKPAGGVFGAWASAPISGTGAPVTLALSQLVGGAGTTRQIWPSAANFSPFGRQVEGAGSSTDFGPFAQIEYEWSFRLNSVGGAAAGDTYEFRAIMGVTGPFVSYTNTPSLVATQSALVVAPAAQAVAWIIESDVTVLAKPAVATASAPAPIVGEVRTVVVAPAAVATASAPAPVVSATFDATVVAPPAVAVAGASAPVVGDRRVVQAPAALASASGIAPIPVVRVIVQQSAALIVSLRAAPRAAPLAAPRAAPLAAPLLVEPLHVHIALARAVAEVLAPEASVEVRNLSARVEAGWPDASAEVATSRTRVLVS